jgi:hypothetical protein
VFDDGALGFMMTSLWPATPLLSFVAVSAFRFFVAESLYKKLFPRSWEWVHHRDRLLGK